MPTPAVISVVVLAVFAIVLITLMLIGISIRDREMSKLDTFVFNFILQASSGGKAVFENEVIAACMSYPKTAEEQIQAAVWLHR
ncbi:MAG TPA: hypothetical protein VEA59_04765 [Patescibacteria group bacterium]|nr:hypothetical protein [Patescibacteria group bacterium]